MNLNMKCAIGILINFRDGRGGGKVGNLGDIEHGIQWWYRCKYVIVHMQIDQFIQVNFINF